MLMLEALRGQESWRRAFAVLVLLALALKLMVPAGFMPGASLAVPIVLCPGQAAPPAAKAMAHHGHHEPSKAPDRGDHPCPYAATASTPLAAHSHVIAIKLTGQASTEAMASLANLAPGLGLAAPPPPSHAPPAFRA
ncbi:MAG TPA: hypothetical protein VM900_07165 [Sphingomonas sp.]|nr:hypothetical protein [Sphingomonas sp.]